MENIKQLKTAIEVRSEICCLGHFVNRLVNGSLEFEFDLKNPCGDSDIIGNNLFPSSSEYREAYLYKGIVSILYNDGTLVEIEASPRKYFTREEVYLTIDKLYNKKDLFIEEQFIGAKMSRKISRCSINEVKTIIDGLYQQNHTTSRDFIIFNNELHYQRFDSKTLRVIDIKITEKLGVYDDRMKKTPKIIQSNKFKTHMKIHEREFIIPYSKLIEYVKNSGKFKELQDNFIEMMVEFPYHIGYTSLCETNENHTTVYAKRKGRDIYTRFTLDGEREKTNKCIVILKKSFEKDDEYFLITMFPGEYLVKEPQDRNFQSEQSRKTSVRFWENHALIFEPKTVDLESIKYMCPYNNSTVTG